MVPLKTIHGEAKAWEALQRLDPADVCRRAAVTYDEASHTYTLRSFGMDFLIAPENKTITSSSRGSGLILDRLKDFSRLSFLWYLVDAKDIVETGRLLKPVDVKGGQRFSAGTHLLPLDQIAAKYGTDKQVFIDRGMELGAEIIQHADVTLKLFPLPRVPVSLILWLEDEEFPARADLLFDSTCSFHVPTSDIIWAIAVLSTLVFCETCRMAVKEE